MKVCMICIPASRSRYAYHAGKETENKYVFKREQKTGKVIADVTSVGRLFHKRLPVTTQFPATLSQVSTKSLLDISWPISQCHTQIDTSVALQN